MSNTLQKRRGVGVGNVDNILDSNNTFTSIELEEAYNDEEDKEKVKLDNFLEKNQHLFLLPESKLMEDELNVNSGRRWLGGRFYKYFEYYKNHQELICLLILTLLSMFTRYYRIGEANKPIWDEVHFGKFGSYYLRGKFYHDVHPPLGKMLVGVGGKIAGYDGTFDFESGKYPDNMNYTFMRWWHANFGVALVPISYLTCKKLGFSNRAALLTAWMVLFDNGFTVISRFILLDSMLLCFIAMSLYYFVSFHKEQKYPFSYNWYYNLCMLGISLGLASSVKWIGFFAVALVGLVNLLLSLFKLLNFYQYTIENLYNLLGQTNFSTKIYVKHWVARIFGLIILPILVYVLCFKIHFSILNNSGPGDSTMDTLFQAKLNHNTLWNSPPEMVYMGNVTIRSNSLSGGLLHSHPHFYPSGSKEQQITCYGYKDSNNDWTVKPIKEVNNDNNSSNLNPITVKSGDLIQLYHIETKKYLKVQPNFNSIVTGKRAYEVSGSVLKNDNDNDNFVWKIEIIDDLLLNSKPETIQTLSTRFKLRNPKTNCLLSKDYNNYPEWGFSQSEVYCIKDGDSDHEETLWNIESLQYEGLSPGKKKYIPSFFFRNFIRIHRAMWTTNNALIPDEDKLDHLTSHALDWPFMLRGIRMCGWGDHEIKFYMLGNPFVWWGSTLGLMILIALMFYYLIRMKRKVKEWVKDDWYDFLFTFKVIIGGYLLHYLPFFLMGRVLYVHHYFPALYFACLALPYVLDFLLSFKKEKLKDRIFFIIGLIISITYIYFAPMTFGMNFPSIQFKNRMWLKTWYLTGPEGE